MKKMFLNLLVCILFTGSAFAAMSDEDFVEFCRNGSLQEINNAIQNGANVNARDFFGVTPLMFAAANNPNAEVITTLIKAGADINARAKTPTLDEGNGSTALIAAALYSNPEVIMTLLKFGADAKAKDYNGKMAIDYAKKNENLKNTDAYWKLNNASY